jgi:excinuclease UvrABC nuclease subunit
LKTFKSVSAIKAATMDELLRVLPQNAAAEVYKHFHP